MPWSQRFLTGGGAAAALCLVLSATAGTAAAARSLVPTTTRLTASVTASRYDSPVTFTAKVSAASGTPAGSVTFVDTSNGSVLDTAQLTKGTARFTTAALAPGPRLLVARYNGTTTFAKSASAALGLPVAAAGSDAVAYQIDAHHDGRQAAGSLKTSTLTRKWHVTLGGPGGFDLEAGDVSYPLIAGGRVFVTVENSQSYGSHLYALNAGTGAADWSVGLSGTYGFSALAYDGRALFALNYDGLLTAFSAGTGRELWSAQMPGQYAFTAPPTAYDGVVYVSGAGLGGTVYAVSEADGRVRWTQGVQNGDKSSPAVDSGGVFVSYACQQDYGFSLRGHLLWHHSTSCEGGGGSTPVVAGTSVYARGAFDTPVILSKARGASTGTFATQTAPAFDSTNMYTLQNGNLVATDPTGSPDRWTFANGKLVTAPVVIGNVVFVGDSTGRVYGIAAGTGHRIWSGVAGSTIIGPDEQNADVLIGLAAGGGLLLVPAGNALSAFGG
jgi:outer membrane protein assembly factor BamB